MGWPESDCALLTHGATLQRGAANFSLWASHARRVELVLNPGPQEFVRELQPEPGGWFQWMEAEAREGLRYLYQLDGQRRLPDPASRWQPEGVHQASALFDSERHAWRDLGWQGVPLTELVLYELHVGTFTADGTFDAIIKRLPLLRELGVTAIELMPVAQFAGKHGWGYDGVYPFAVHQAYGGPRALQKLVDACHQAGLAVILDVVYNHAGPEGNYLSQFGPYFTDRYPTPWGPAFNFDDRDCEPVRQFVRENVRWWLRDFHLDGLRLDAVHSIHDASSKHILQEIGEVAALEAASSGRLIHVLAESDLNDVRLLDLPERGGYGVHAQWNDDFHHSVHALLTNESTGYYADFGSPEHLVKALASTFVYDGCHSSFRGRKHGAPIGEHSGERFVVSIQNHDQVGNRVLGDRLATLCCEGRQRLAAALLLLAPHVPLLFMGEEYGETHPFPYFCDFGDRELIESVRQGRRQEFAAFAWPERLPDPFAEETFASARLSWSWPEWSPRSGHRRWYQALLALRRNLPALKDYRARTVAWQNCSGERQGILELGRGDFTGAAPKPVLAYFNLSEETQALPVTAHAQAAPTDWQPLTSSEQARFGGLREESDWENYMQSTQWQLLPFEVQVFIRRERNAP